ncbi:ATP-dependent permease MDL2 [Verticillium dahliae]|nr:ATP-dependent permease MDL2 [Verticillium dahliae]
MVSGAARSAVQLPQRAATSLCGASIFGSPNIFIMHAAEPRFPMLTLRRPYFAPRQAGFVGLGSLSRPFSHSRSVYRELQKDGQHQDAAQKQVAEPEHDPEHDFQKSERAAQAAQVNLSAKLSKEGKVLARQVSMKSGVDQDCAPRAQMASCGHVFLVVSSSVTMSIPFSVGRILDIVTKDPAEDARLFGLTLPHFSLRVVARLRSQLYRRTYVQDAEFFDAKPLHYQNISDGLRSLFSGGAGFIAMIWLSPGLTGLLLVMLPPVAIAEERLGNVKTSQAFVGEVQEINRYNKQVRRIFALGRKESTIAATFFATTAAAGNMTILAMLIVGGNYVRTGAMSVGDLTSFMMYTAFAGSSLFGLSSFYSELMKGVGAASRLFELQDRHPSISQTVGSKVESAQGVIKFNNLSFAYPTRPAVNVFNGSHHNQRRVDISQMNIKSLRRRIGMVAQEPVFLWHHRREHCVWKTEATRAQIVVAARKANCTLSAIFLPAWTRRRGTSALDAESETLVNAALASLLRGRNTTISIAHRLSTIKRSDLIIQARITEQDEIEDDLEHGEAENAEALLRR